MSQMLFTNIIIQSLVELCLYTGLAYMGFGRIIWSTYLFLLFSLFLEWKEEYFKHWILHLWKEPLMFFLHKIVYKLKVSLRNLYIIMFPILPKNQTKFFFSNYLNFWCLKPLLNFFPHQKEMPIYINSVNSKPTRAWC